MVHFVAFGAFSANALVHFGSGIQVLVLSYIKTSSAGAEISHGPHKRGLRRAGPNDFMFVYHLIL